MDVSRRRLIETGLCAAGLSLVPAWRLRADDVAFASDPFRLGVASGYPEPTSVQLWTRLAPQPLSSLGGMPDRAVTVDWEIAEDERFRRIARSGRFHATPDWSHSVHVDAQGLRPGRDYWYRFTSGNARSPVGHTRSAPAWGSNRMTVAVASCQHYESGYYAAYGAIAQDDFDLVMHLGDYIYENAGTDRVRSHAESECRTLDDYRRRYSIYKQDPMLQASHARCPWMLTWDDHEVDNDYADWHSEQDEPKPFFLARRAAAYQAYYENQPLPRNMAPRGTQMHLHAHRAFGGLLDVYMLDGRQYRSDQACASRGVNVCDALFDNRRTMLGAQQEAWLDSSLERNESRWTLFGQQTVFAHLDQEPGESSGYWIDGWSGYAAARQRLLDMLDERSIANPVVLSGDVHAFLANDVHAEPGNLDSRVVATEFVTTSISSAGPSQATVDSWRAENTNLRFGRSDARGYTKLVIEDDALRAEFVAVDDVSRADSSAYVLASFHVEPGRPGISRPAGG